MKAAFLDRDGVINIDYGYVVKKEEFKFKEGIFELLKLLQEIGFTLFIVTNQSGIARGYYTKEQFFKLMDWMIKEFKKREIIIKDYEFCPHHPNFTIECNCRKPKPGMILNLAKKYNISLEDSILIGDKDSDIKAALNAKIGKSFKVNDSLFDIIFQINNLKAKNEI